MTRQRGFTLIELLIVVSLFSVLTALAVINFSQTRYAGEIDTFARAISNKITEARRRAVQTGNIYLVDIRPTSISYCQRDPTDPAQLTCPSPAGIESSRPYFAGSEARISFVANDVDNPTLGLRPTRNAIGGGITLLIGPSGACDSDPATPATPDGLSLYLEGVSDTNRHRLISVTPTSTRPRITDYW
jgi:type II secretion system protein H